MEMQIFAKLKVDLILWIGFEDLRAFKSNCHVLHIFVISRKCIIVANGSFVIFCIVTISFDF